LKNVSVITPNQKEAEILSGIKVTDRSSAEDAARALHSKGIKTVIITLSSQGALLFDDDAFHFVPAPKVRAVDTTAAGDVFNGALAVAISEDMNMRSAVAFACEAAAISVTRLGAQASAPFRKEISEKTAIQ
jgi:ribokinase